MNPSNLKTKWALALLLAGLTGAVPAMADKPEWAGRGKGKGGHDNRIDQRNESRSERREDDGPRRSRDDRSDGRRSHFEERHSAVVRDYYAKHYRDGRCPPGLAKKRNGCMPPGQAKKWRAGRPLPRDVRYYEVPPPLVMQIGPPPSGYRYVRVASDILMIAIGTGMVVDAIQNLGR